MRASYLLVIITDWVLRQSAPYEIKIGAQSTIFDVSPKTSFTPPAQNSPKRERKRGQFDFNIAKTEQILGDPVKIPNYDAESSDFRDFMSETLPWVVQGNSEVVSADEFTLYWLAVPCRFVRTPTHLIRTRSEH